LSSIILNKITLPFKLYQHGPDSALRMLLIYMAFLVR